MVKAGITAGIWLLAIVFFFLNKDCFYGVDGAGASSLLTFICTKSVHPIAHSASKKQTMGKHCIIITFSSRFA